MLKAKAAKVLALMVLTFAAATSAQAFEKPVLIAEQGSFAAGGTVIKSAGSFNYSVSSDQSGQSLHGDHAYLFIKSRLKLINIRWFFCMVPGNRLKPGKPLLMAEMDFKIFF